MCKTSAPAPSVGAIQVCIAFIIYSLGFNGISGWLRQGSALCRGGERCPAEDGPICILECAELSPSPRCGHCSTALVADFPAVLTLSETASG